MCCPTVSYHEQGVFIVSWYLPVGYDTHLICPQVAVVFIVQPFLQVSYSIGGGHILPSVCRSKEVFDMNFRHYIIQSEKNLSCLKIRLKTEIATLGSKLGLVSLEYTPMYVQTREGAQTRWILHCTVTQPDLDNTERLLWRDCDTINPLS